MKIKFNKNTSYQQNNAANSREYKAGVVYDLPPDQARRWIRRQVADEVPDEPKRTSKPEPTKAETKPEPKADAK